MIDLVPHLLLGVGNGAVFAALALGLVLTYRSSGVLNLATGAVALYAAYTFALLRQGQLFVPLPGVSTNISVGGDMTVLPAMVIALIAATLLGVLSYIVVFRPLRSAPPAARVVASVGLMVVIQGAIAAKLSTTLVTVAPIFPNSPLRIGGMAVQRDRLYFGVTILAIALVLAALMRYTRFGLATRAAAESEKGAALTGLSHWRIALSNWVLSSLIAGVAGILIAPMVPLRPYSYTLFIVPALAAALLGRFSDIAPAVIGGLVIGMLESEVVFLQVDHPSLPQSGLQEMIPLLLIFFLLVFRGRSLPSRGELITHSLGRAPRPRSTVLPSIVFGAAAIGLIFATQGQYRAALITSVIMGVISLSLVVVTGYTGQISFAQLTLAGASGFLLSDLTTHWGVPFPVAPLLAALGATGLGLIVGLSSLRVRGMSVAVVTLALAVAVEAFWFDNSAYTGGLNGALVKPPSLIGLDLSVGAGTQRATFGIMCVLVLVTVAVSVAMLRRSRLGGAMLAVRANERSAAAAGINVRVVKLLAFGISAFIAGLGGDLLVYQQTSVSAASFSAIGGIALFATVYLAGVTSVSGGVIGGMLAAGGLFFIVLDKGFNTGSWYDVITGIALILTVIANPEGLARGVHKLGDLWHFRRSGSTGRHGSADSIDMDPGVADRPRVAQSIRSSADRSGPPLLEVSDVSVSYGGVVALNNVSLSVPAGAVVGLIGPNGAGKTTLVDAISGFATMQGDIRFAGQSISGLKPHRRIRRGLARTFQGIELYDDLTVAENVSVGDQSRRLGGEDLPKLLRPLGLEPLLSRPVAELSQGRRQLVSIARSLAGGPSLLLLDEPAAGLDSRESEWLAERLREIRTRGVTLLVIDHDMNLMLNLCDQLYVLDVGSIIASGTPDEVSRNERVRQAYLGAPREAESTPRGDSLPLDVETHLDVR